MAFCFAAGISTTVKILEVVYQLQATDEQTSDILKTTSHVERNLKEAQRLLAEKGAFLDRNVYEWVVSNTHDARSTLQSIAKLMEPARVDKMINNDVGIITKTSWAFKYNTQARDKHVMLNVCHQTLLAVITHLHSIKPPTMSGTLDRGALLPPPSYDNNMEKLWDWRDQRSNRQRSTTRLRSDTSGAPASLVTSDRHELEAPSLTLDTYSSTAQTDSRRGVSAEEARSYDTYHHPSSHLNAPQEPAPSQREAFELSNRLIPPRAPYSFSAWPNRSRSSISFSESVIELPGENRTAASWTYTSYKTAAPLDDRKHHLSFEMSATPPSPGRKRTPSPIGQGVGRPSKSVDPSISSSSSGSSPALVSIGNRVVGNSRTGDRSHNGTKLRGSWLAYQTSLRVETRHGREGT